MLTESPVSLRLPETNLSLEDRFESAFWNQYREEHQSEGTDPFAWSAQRRSRELFNGLGSTLNFPRELATQLLTADFSKATQLSGEELFRAAVNSAHRALSVMGPTDRKIWNKELTEHIDSLYRRMNQT